MRYVVNLKLAVAVLGCLGLAACKKDSDPAPQPPPPPPPAPAATYTVGGTLSGLSGSVTLTNNGGDARTLTANGVFTFATPLLASAAYAVTVTSQPATQTCAVTSGAGTIAAANIAGVMVTCTTNTFTVGGAVTGLAGTGLVLQNNGADNLARAADGAFTFATAVASGGAYNVTVLTQPGTPAQTCTPTSNTGTVTTAVSNVVITCVTNPATVGSASIGPAGGTVNGFYGAQIIIPPGALANTVTIGLSRGSTGSPAFDVADTDTVGATYELTPHGQTFTLPVTLRIPFDASQVSNDSSAVLSKAESGGTFSELPTTVDGNFLVATVTGFSWVMPTAAVKKPRMVYAVQNPNGAGTLSLASHRIDVTSGALGAATSSAPVGDFPTSAVAHPSGRWVFATNAGSSTVNGIAPNSVSTYLLNQTNGSIVGPAVSTVATHAAVGFRTTMPVVHPSGKFLYVMNFGNPSFNGGGDMDRFAIDGATGALTLSNNVVTGNGAQPLGVAFNRLGTRAWVLFDGGSLSNPLSGRVALYNVDITTGDFTGPVSSTLAGVVGGGQRSIAIDPNEKSLSVACLSTNEVFTFGINASNGALTSLGGLSVPNKPASIAADRLGRFMFVAKQEPSSSVNLHSYALNATSGALTLADRALTGCTGGACVGPIATITEPQGNFVYALDSRGALSAFSVNPASGVLSAAGSLVDTQFPSPGGVGFPFTFAATGISPIWQSNCTQSCTLEGFILIGGSGGGGSTPTNPSPPSSHFLQVTQTRLGFVTSSPAGINVAPATSSNPLGNNAFRAAFAANSSVTLCVDAPPPNLAAGLDVTWGGSCSGTNSCATVQMTRDRDCTVTFTEVVFR